MTTKVRLKADDLARLCLKRGIVSDTQLANLAGINRTTIYRLRKGSRGPGTRVLNKLATALDVSIEELFEVSDETDAA